jgi:O-antigen ligase
VVYGGGLQFLGALSPYLLYGFYLVLGACLGLCVLARPDALAGVRCLRVYLLWILFYVLWGTVVSRDAGLVLPYGLRLLFRNLFITAAFVIAVGDRRHLATLVRFIGASAVINCAISLWEANNPILIEQLARFLNPDSVSFRADRPSGLWTNANESAFAFLFAMLLSLWDRGWFPWLVRLASIVGIYLTASRTGMYLMILCGLSLGLYRLRSLTRSMQAAAVVLNLAWVGGLCLAVLGATLSTTVDLSEDGRVARILDFSESSTREQGGFSRAELAAEAADAALNGPWYGRGLFTFQDVAGSEGELGIPIGAHNIYLTVWGEVGVVGLAVYLAVLGLGLLGLFTCRAALNDWLGAALLWACYLTIGFAWHNQLASVSGMIYVALLYRLPGVVCLPLRARRHRPIPSSTGVRNVAANCAV